MNTYTLLANPGHNRIYLDAALKISILELRALSEKFDLGIGNIEESKGHLPAALQISADKEWTSKELLTIGSSSIFYALFKNEGELLRPLSVPDFHVFPESMVQILKYNGKTNEQFTRLLVNLAISACRTHTENMHLLDPVAGKGTTLYEALMRGMHVSGVEVNDKWTHEVQVFLQRYMKEGRYKHSLTSANMNDEKGRKKASSFKLECAADAKDYKAGKKQTLNMYSADTRIADELMRKASVDMIVADLPYGVQHGSRTDKRSRSPLELLQEALPAWLNLLKTKGSIVLAFNEFTMRYHEVAKLLDEHGLSVFQEAPYRDFTHRVDQSINRNVVVAVKKGTSNE